MPQVEREIKRALWDAGISYKEVAAFIGKSYATLIHYLNGFTSMPPEVKKKIRGLIEESKQKNAGSIDNE